MKVVIATPTLTRPHPACVISLEAAIPALDAAGIEHSAVWEVNCPYISHARATMLRKALDVKADAIVFIDHDMSYRPDDLVKLIMTEGDVVSGLYRFKKDEEEYMGVINSTLNGMPVVNSDGTIEAEKIPAGFLKITKECVDRFMKVYPELTYGHAYNPSTDLFNHGAYKGVWYGEDYSFSRRWKECGGTIKVVPDLNLDHHTADNVYKGNFHKFLMRQPGGSKHA